MGQDHALPLIQNPLYDAEPVYTATELDSATLTTTYQYLFVDTLNRTQRRESTLRSYFSGFPVRFCWRPDSVTGMATDSTSITYLPIVSYDNRSGTFLTGDYDEAGNSQTVTIWSNYDWTDGLVYTIDINLDAPVLGLEFTFIKVEHDAVTADNIEIEHWIIKQ